MSERSVAKKCTINVSRLLLSLTLAVGGILADGAVVAQTNYEPSAEGLQARRAFQDAKFGRHLTTTYALIHRLQPATLIIPNHHQKPKPGEDVQTFERDLHAAMPFCRTA